ncbi:hypothetical protein DES49_0198 [Halospina denitrificans]|uniref:ABC-type amino acid transport substrate-binding protein n=1 Tax=Halospina denitrificans TaxID=332522 RepID=A0A4R7K3C7_9GAMM|nr:hypothetical protein [Halospina denitrificans]TDT44099.1 hypothetical protein DES49_0198 [Halospina denitrificans]
MIREFARRYRGPGGVVLGLILMVSGITVSTAAEPVVLWKRNFESPAIRSLLAIALEKTPEYGEADLVSSVPISQARALRYLEHGRHKGVRVANVASSPERNSTLQPIRIPIDQGLLGFRVCLISEGDQPRFDGIYTASQFRERGLRIGQGAHWPDTRILRASGFEVVTVPRFENLLSMLERQRFDCFLRGAGEVLIDLAQYDSDDIVVEERLLFTYRMPSFFFVGPDDERLAQRIETGLHRAMQDGSYEQWFSDHFRKPMKQLKLMERVFIPLPNPYLNGQDTPIQLPLMPIRAERFLPVPEGTR